jgi:hypothetical protein
MDSSKRVLLQKCGAGLVSALWLIVLAILLPIGSVSQGPVTGIAPGYSLTMLSNGEWLMIGSRGGSGPIASAAIVNAHTGRIQAAGALNRSRAWHTATVLPDGKVLIAGGIDADGHVLAGPEIFDPEQRNFEALPASGLTARAYHSATLLTDGSVLLAGRRLGRRHSPEVGGSLGFPD